MIELSDGKKIFNMMPHTVSVYDDHDKVVMSIPSDGFIRCSVMRKKVAVFDGVPVNKTTFTGADLPDHEPDTFYIVSKLTAEALKEMGRTEDILVPDQVIRHEGKIVGCKSFSKI